jgi:hypothetical protein
MSLWEYLGIDPEDSVERWEICVALANTSTCPRTVNGCRSDATSGVNDCGQCWETAINNVKEVIIKCAE